MFSFIYREKKKKKPRWFLSEVLEGFHLQQKCVRTVQYIHTMGFKQVKADVSVSVLDHLQTGNETAQT